MGISGLIPFLENASTPIDVRSLQGSSVAVDSYCWLHKGVFGCAEKLARGEDTDIYINYCLKFVDMLTKYRIKVIMVFDGRHLPAKAETERRRREARQESKRLAKEYLRKNDIEKARSHMRRAIDVTHEMALRLIKSCRERGVECIVAPYEADAQMAWLNKAGFAEYIITEDSDLTLFGAERILFKLDLNGNALLVEKSKLHLAMGCKPEKYTFEKFRRMCILSGCDYLDSLPGIGLKKACKFMLTTEEDDMTKALKKLPKYLNMKQLEVSDDYVEQFLKAEATFRHMFVYNPSERRMQRLYDLEDYETDEKYCSNAGTLLEDENQALNLALGNLNPFSLKQLDDWHPDKDWSNGVKDKKLPKHISIWKNDDSHKHIDQKPAASSVGAILTFKKIEYKNETETELQEKYAEERLKLEEAEVFTMYSYAKTTSSTKRKRSISSSDAEDEEASTSEAATIQTKYFNPFAIGNDATKTVPKSPVCANKSLLRVLSPRKDNHVPEAKQNVIVNIKSRFFSQNVKMITQKSSAVRDLMEEMTKIEEKQASSQEKQEALYGSLSPQFNNHSSPVQKTNAKDNTDDGEETTSQSQTQELQWVFNSATQTSSATQAVSKVISLLEDDEDDNMQRFTPSQKSNSSTDSQRRLGLAKPKPLTKKQKNDKPADSKQSTLSMFGFQKRPTIPKIKASSMDL